MISIQPTRRLNKRSPRIVALSLLVLIGAMAIGGFVQKTDVDLIKERGFLEVVTRNSPTTYYQDRNEEVGFEFELAQLFADRLGVELRIRTLPSLDDVIEEVRNGNADLAAAGLTITDDRSVAVDFSDSYLEVTQQLVYRKGTKRPRSIEDLSGGRLLVTAESSHALHLRKLQETVAPTLTWQESSDVEMVEALQMVNNGDIDYTIVDSNEYEMMRGFFPKLRMAFDVSREQDLGWAFNKNSDESLKTETEKFFNEIRHDGTLLQLQERYYGHLDQLDNVSTLTFLNQADRRLKRYRKHFEGAAEKYDLDWRLLAAIGYQESHWKSRAKSFTGVRGLMMLTRVTAREVGVKNRLNAKQSIYGGAKYYSRLKRQYRHLAEPERTWFALAAYNVGAGHLNDARKITEQQGADPNKWIDVKERLPLLSKKKWYSKTKYGYARGHEPVKYVQNIRRYFDLIAWYDQPKEGMFAQNKEKMEGVNVSRNFTTVPPLL